MKNPNEIFTRSIGNISEEAVDERERHFCRFMDKECNKQSRLIDYPMGVCSVNVGNAKPIICPNRFLENNTVFENIAQAAFGTSNNVLVFAEVKLKDVGNFDFVLVKHRPISSEVEDFCVVEFQSDSTTGTGKLVQALKDFVEEGHMDDKYAFGMNTYNTIKLSYIQMLIKGQVMESWDKKIFWVMQNYVFDNMLARFNLVDLEHDVSQSTQYHVYDLNESNNLILVENKSTSVANLITAFTHQPTPSIDSFIQKLEEKIQLTLGLSIN